MKNNMSNNKSEIGMKKQGNLQRKLVASFLLAGIIPFLLLGIIALQRSAKNLEDAIFDELQSIQRGLSIAVEQYLDDEKQLVESRSYNSDIQELSDTLHGFFNTNGFDATGRLHISSDGYNNLWKEFGDKVKRFQEITHVHDAYVICIAHGHVIYSVGREDDLGINLKYGEHKNSGLAKAWDKAIKTDKTAFIDFSMYKPNNDEPRAFLATPVKDDNGITKSIFAVSITPERLNEILHSIKSEYETLETYMVGPDGYMRSDSKLNPLVYSVINSFKNQDRGRIETEAVRRAVAGESGHDAIIDYRNERVLSAFAPIHVTDNVTWAILAEIDEKEANLKVVELRTFIIIAAIVLTIIIVVGAYFLSRSIYMPIRKNIVEMESASEQLNLSAQKGLSGSTEQVSAITQINTAFTELTTMSQQVLKSSEGVVTAAESTNVASSEGNHSLEKATEGMQKVREEVNKVVENMMNLREKTKQMDLALEIINELSAQTTILSYNATIEAEGVGKDGRRFSALAELIMKLANKATDSSKNIKQLIEDVQKGANTTLLATEDGMKAVDAGMESISDSKNHFKAILAASEETVDLAKEIEITTGQQDVALKETSESVNSIHIASEDIKSSSLEIQDAGSHVNSIAQQLAVL